MVAITISGLIAGMVASATLTNRNLYQNDLGRTRVNQNLKSALSIVGGEIRQAGERFPASFPAVLITDGGGSASDELIVRRNLVNQVVVGCDSKIAGVTYSGTALSRTSATTAVCTAPNQSGNYTAWSSYAASQSGQVPIYIFNQTTRNGEFLKLLSTVGSVSGGIQYINFTPKLFTYGYTQEATSYYIMSQWRIRLLNGVLQIIINEDQSSIQNVIAGISSFQVEAVMQDGTTKSALVNGDNWTLLSALRITITGSETMPGGKQEVRTVMGEFFPRNILSN
jgi:type IV pilus assembly protein PilW